MQLELDIIDICLPDYFAGSTRPFIAVAVDGSTTIETLLEGCRAEVRSGAIGGACRPWETGENPDWCAAAHEAIDCLQDAAVIEGQLDHIVCPKLESSDEVSVYAYLVFIDSERDNNSAHYARH